MLSKFINLKLSKTNDKSTNFESLKCLHRSIVTGKTKKNLEEKWKENYITIDTVTVY